MDGREMHNLKYNFSCIDWHLVNPRSLRAKAARTIDPQGNLAPNFIFRDVSNATSEICLAVIQLIYPLNNPTDVMWETL